MFSPVGFSSGIAQDNFSYNIGEDGRHNDMKEIHSVSKCPEPEKHTPLRALSDFDFPAFI
jgi:hypothetical protein